MRDAGMRKEKKTIIKAIQMDASLFSILRFMYITKLLLFLHLYYLLDIDNT